MFRMAQPEDFYRIEAVESPELLMMRKDLDAPGMTERIENWTRTMEVDGHVIAIYGATKIWDGVCKAWSFLTPAALDRYVALTRDVLKGIVLIELRGIKRIEADVLDGHIESHRWHQFLGFEVEGYMKNYGFGGEGNYYLYARTR